MEECKIAERIACESTDYFIVRSGPMMALQMESIPTYIGEKKERERIGCEFMRKR